MPRKVAVLGSTGSIGTQALEIIREREDLELYSILCGSDIGSLSAQMKAYRPVVAAVAEPGVPCTDSDVITGEAALKAAVEGADVVLNAIVGSAGLKASLLCREQGKVLALANKESLVVGGDLLKDYIRSGMVVPVDSEHSTIHRCLAGETGRILGITLTASGGSARDIPIRQLGKTPASRILEHPTWDMGARITVDSATMVNKAFEVIEARWLFGMIPVDVVIHPQSIVHSLVRLADGSWKALLGNPDKRIPIQYALAPSGAGLDTLMTDGPVDWEKLEFMPLDRERYPAFGLVAGAGEEGGTYPAAANAADEVAVSAFLSGRISFGDICRVIDGVLQEHAPSPVTDLEAVVNADIIAREAAGRMVEKIC